MSKLGLPLRRSAAVLGSIAVLALALAGPASARMFGDTVPFYGGTALIMRYANNSSAVACTSGIPWVQANGKAGMVTAGHCFWSTSGDYRPEVMTRLADNSAGTFYGNSAAYLNTLNYTGDVTVPLNGVYAGDAAMITIAGTKSVAGIIQTSDSSTAIIKAYGNAAAGDVLCYTGSKAQGLRCGFEVVQWPGQTGLYGAINGGDLGPVMKATSSVNNCSVSGDSGGPVYQNVTGGVKIVGVVQGSATGTDSNGNFVGCAVIFTPYQVIKNAYGGYGLTNGNEASN